MAELTYIIIILCAIMNCFLAKCPHGIIDKSMSQSEKQRIVDRHNFLRKLVANGNVTDQPRGINLKRLEWDEKLARDAQNIANTCIYAHKQVSDGRFSVGQNLAISKSTGSTKGADWNGMIQLWFDEYKIYRFSAQYSPATGHYTQLVWANTKYVGCAYVNFRTDGFWKYQKLYVCNYGPAGNYLGEYPYKTGTKGCENLC